MSEAWITYRGLALHLSVRDGGADAPAVVFVHGMGMHAACFESMIPRGDFLGALAAEGVTVVGLDLQGHGRSEGRRGHVPFRAALGNIAEAVGFAAERFGRPVGLAGSGLGGFLALYAGLEDDRVAAVASHTVADLRDVGRFDLRARRRALAWGVGRARRLAHAAPFLPLPLRAVYSPADVFEDPEHRSRWRAQPRTTWRYTMDTLVSLFLTPDDKPAVEAMAKPVLVVSGEEDLIVPLAGQLDVVGRLPDAELFTLGGAGHMLPLEHTAQTAGRMAEWLRKHVARAGA